MEHLLSSIKEKEKNAEKEFKKVAPFPFEYYQIIGFIQVPPS
jgi:hypothetical protein